MHNRARARNLWLVVYNSPDCSFFFEHEPERRSLWLSVFLDAGIHLTPAVHCRSSQRIRQHKCIVAAQGRTSIQNYSILLHERINFDPNTRLR